MANLIGKWPTTIINSVLVILQWYCAGEEDNQSAKERSEFTDGHTWHIAAISRGQYTD